MPQVVVNLRIVKEVIEVLGSSTELAKRVLSRLSYTPTAQLYYYS
jgi:hypothetical protein